MININKAEGIPLYIQIRESIRELVASGVLKPGQKIPSEEELSAKYRVSRATLRQGILELIEEGVLYRRHGIGTFVTQAQIERDHTRLTNFFEGSKINGIEGVSRLLSADVIPSTPKLAKQLSLQEGELVIRIVTLRSTRESPVTLHKAHIPYKLFSSILQENLEDRHLWDIMDDFGYPVKRAVQKLEAREADEELSQLLEVDIGSPILYKERTVYSDDGTPVEFTLCYNRGDRYSIIVTLNR